MYISKNIEIEHKCAIQASIVKKRYSGYKRYRVTAV